MAVQKPLVLINGIWQQIPVADQIGTAAVASGTATAGFVPKSNGDGTATWAADNAGSSSGLSIGKDYAINRGFACQ